MKEKNNKAMNTVAILAVLMLLSSIGMLAIANPVLAQEPIYNTAFITDAQLEDYNSMTASQIQVFLASYNSYFKQSIQDVDGQVFNPSTVIAQAASQYHINPKVILATLQKESAGVTRTTRPSNTMMRFLMGCVSPNTARQQLTCAAERFRAYQDQLTTKGSTVGGWKVGTSKTTQDGVVVTPANKVIAGQFTYTPYAGMQWGGNQPSVGGVYLFYSAWNNFGFNLAPITVTYPNGGEYWRIGTFQTIKWSYTGNSGSSAKIELVKSTGAAATLANWAPIGSGGKGSYSFWLLQSAGSYKVRITTSSGSDMSNGYFTIS